MKHKTSILICELDNGQLNLFVNGVAVLEGDKLLHPIKGITNVQTSAPEVIKNLSVVASILTNIETEKQKEKENKECCGKCNCKNETN